MLRHILVSITQRLGLYKLAVNAETTLRNRKLKRSFKHYGLEALLQADKALRSIGSFAFLDFGTLLGAYREKGFIPYDFDLDVGILHDTKLPQMNQALLSHGFKHIKEVYLKESGQVVEEVYSYKGVQIDFFVYFKQGDELYCYLGRRHETKSAEEANATDGFPTRLSWVTNKGFTPSDFLGYSFYMPNNAPQWLEDIYGASYMTPIKNWSEFDQKTRIVFHNERVYRRYF